RGSPAAPRRQSLPLVAPFRGDPPHDGRFAPSVRPPTCHTWVAGKPPEVRMKGCSSTHLNSGGSSHGAIVGSPGPSCPVRLHLLGSHRVERLSRAPAAARVPGALLP